MLPKIKNAIIFISIAAALVLVYVFFIKDSSPEESLVSSSLGDIESHLADVPPTPSLTADQDFLPLLLNIKDIRLDHAIFSDPAFLNLVDGSILLVPEGNEGRPNPFAPLGAENITGAPLKSSSAGSL
ncbi:hypothetical protein A3D42_01465 [Candidatus Nomurabacteria bacterium RIFCSPHIGHO2_02_FULL_41_18]|uniref:Uncharacterized protein n=1 Tax=Candidatus Nomurabacteria bacterium RIFCSPHIGHO2_02_FULL_41_18 TaxID=1801754 RepID=A0A1F6W7E1_9BACT|nr:MAG: hypothetical protein A2737_00330 [Candidatus Nomurabacteria bacterium RIFCSPHIGHO2_01_FULL_41_71]OGI77860.1 MAG: hypothetical protein A3D42_01465 [Candidatus Nomurabacteria bacterium RIFCSPHIGHO2_02_FULL_41_18]OGI90035.1 MAG: hypothetical protein A3B01_02160 [Candidatus Nomurabacteria bacterium RIFCSPLOWO2_01_FULL_41_52b]